MSKKVIGLAVTVALLMIVLSGCFLLPKPALPPQVVKVVMPANGQNIVVAPNETGNVKVEAYIKAQSPIDAVYFSLYKDGALSISQQSANGPYQTTEGTFTYTFTGLKAGSYTLNVQAYTKNPRPAVTNSSFEISHSYLPPKISNLTVKSNYMDGKHYVTGSPIQFSVEVTNPNNTGTPVVSAEVNGNPAEEVSKSNNTWTFKYTPNVAGSYTFGITAKLPNATPTAATSVVENVDWMPSVSNLKLKISKKDSEDYAVALSSTSVSFSYESTNVKATVSVNGTVFANENYTSDEAISGIKADQWNEVKISFVDKWGNPLPSYTKLFHVLGTQKTNPKDTPYVFLIDRQGHIVNNTNDWIVKNAGDEIHLYGYILKGKNDINNYDITESYYTDEDLTSKSTNGVVLADNNVKSSDLINNKIPIVDLVAYLFDESNTNDAYVKFNVNVNGAAVAFLRYKVLPVFSPIKLSIEPNGNTYEGVPENLTVTVESSQPLVSLSLDRPIKVSVASDTSFSGYSTTTAYAYTLNGHEYYTNVINFSHTLIASVDSVRANGISAYGTLNEPFSFKVAFYGPSGTYQIGAKAEALADQVSTAITTYKVQADTGAPTIKITPAGSYAMVNVNGTEIPAYYGNISVTATITDDHAIYWGGLAFENVNNGKPAVFMTYPNDSNILNYGQTATSLTALVPFNNGDGKYTVYAVASDKHFDPTKYLNGNETRSASLTLFYDHSAPTASLVGGRYDIDATSEYYSFTIEATDGNGVGIADTAYVTLTPLNGGNATTLTANLVSQGSNYYKVFVNTDSLPNARYSMSVTVMDKLYNLIPANATTVREEHESVIDTGYVTVHHIYPDVSISDEDGNALSATTTTTINNDVFRININDAQFPWDWIDPSNFKNFVNITLVGPTQSFEPVAKLMAKHHTPGATFGYLEVEVPEIYLNSSENSSTPATVTMQVDVYDSVQPDKALFGRATAKFVPAEPLFTATPKVTLNGADVNFGSSTPVVATEPTSEFNIEVTLSGLAQKPGMGVTFYANGEKVGSAPASDGTYQLSIPVQPDWNKITLTAVYAATDTVTYSTSRPKALASTNYYTYSYTYHIGTFTVLGDTIEPAATITANGINVTNISTIVKADKVDLSYGINGVAFYRHDELVKYYNDLLKNTTIKGVVTLKTANGQTTFATATLGATDSLAATTADFVTGSKYAVLSQKLSEATEAGIYNISFTATDPFRNANIITSATVVIDLSAPVINYATADVVAPEKVPSISNNDALTFGVKDDAGVAEVEASITNLIYKVSKDQQLTLSTNGIGAFNATVNGTVELPTYVGAEFQNMPYVLTINAKDIAGRSATSVSRLFVTNVDHDPMVNNITAIAPNKVLVVLSEPMWVEGFKKFTAYVNSTSYTGTITSVDISATNNTDWLYEGQAFASQFVVTFANDIWSSSLINPFPYDVRKDLTNVRMLNASDQPIVDLAGNEFTMPINTTTPPILTVTPMATVVGLNTPYNEATFTINATSAAGIEKVVGQFSNSLEGQKVIYTPTGTMTFDVESPTSTGLYAATFTAYDNSINHNTKTVVKYIYVNGAKPSVEITSAPATVGSGATFTVLVEATVGDPTGNNKITSVTVDGVAAVPDGSDTWLATLTAISSGTYEFTATAKDLYGNVGTSASTKVLVDDTAPTIDVTLVPDSGTTYVVAGTLPFTTKTSATETYELYYNGTSGTPVTIYGTVTDNSGSDVTVEAIYNGSQLSTSGTTKVTFNNVLASGKSTLVVKANDQFGNVDTATITLIATEDTEVSTVDINATPTGVSAASPTANISYTVTDALSGIDSAMITVESTSGSKESTTINAGSSQTFDLMPLLKQLPIINKGATDVYVTITATDNVGNAKTSSVATVNVNLTFEITDVSTSSTYIAIKFNTLAVASSSFVPSDIYFYNTTTGLTYDASAVQVPNLTTIATVTDLSLNGNEVSIANLPSGTYKVYVSGIVSANNFITLLNGDGSVLLTK